MIKKLLVWTPDSPWLCSQLTLEGACLGGEETNRRVQRAPLAAWSTWGLALALNLLVEHVNIAFQKGVSLLSNLTREKQVWPTLQ